MKHLIPLISLFFLIGCLNDSDPFGDPVDQTDYLEEYATQEGVIQTNSGLLYKVLEEGEGERPAVNNVVYIERFDGKLIDNRTFSRSTELSYLFLNQNLIPGLLEGIQLMNTGATYEFVLPTELGFGNNPPPPSNTLVRVRPGAVLVYEITLDSYLIDPNDFLTQNATKEGIMITDSGLQYKIIEEGEGDSPSPTSEVRIKYSGSLTNDLVFDSRTTNFKLHEVIDGFSEGLQLMNEGAKFQFFIPPELGYANNPDPQSLIPPGAVLIFEIDLIEIVN